MSEIWFSGGDTKNRENAYQILNSLGYEGIFFEDIVAIQKKLLAGECPQAVFVCIERNIPQTFEIMDNIRKRKVWLSIPILVVLAVETPEIKFQIAEMGIDGVLIYPLSLTFLEQELQKAFQRRKLFTRL